MNLYILSYHLRGYRHDYTPLYESIKVNFPDWKHVNENTWLIKTDKTAKEIAKAIHENFSWDFPSADSYFIAEVNVNNIEGFIPTSAWDWIKELRNNEAF